MTNTGKAILGILIVAVLGIVIYLGWQWQRPPKMIDQVYVQYFQERLVAQAIADVGMPIEGFDNNLFIIAYPGMIQADFANVQTFEGKYVLSGETVEFVRTKTQPISTAERTISDEGYETLLINLSSRLNISVKSNASVDSIIEAIDTASRVEASINQGASQFGLQIIPQEVLEDSRCPIDVQCIQAGTVRVKALVSTSSEQSSQAFTMNESQMIYGYTVTLVNVSPIKESTVTVQPADYRFYFEIKKP